MNKKKRKKERREKSKALNWLLRGVNGGSGFLLD